MTGEHKEIGKNKSIMCQGLFESTYYSHTNTSQLPDQYSTCQLARSIEDCVTFLPPPPHLTPSHTHTCTGHKHSPTPVSREMDQLPVQQLTS